MIKPKYISEYNEEIFNRIEKIIPVVDKTTNLFANNSKNFYTLKSGDINTKLAAYSKEVKINPKYLSESSRKHLIDMIFPLTIEDVILYLDRNNKFDLTDLFARAIEAQNPEETSKAKKELYEIYNTTIDYNSPDIIHIKELLKERLDSIDARYSVSFFDVNIYNLLKNYRLKI